MISHSGFSIYKQNTQSHLNAIYTILYIDNISFKITFNIFCNNFNTIGYINETVDFLLTRNNKKKIYLYSLYPLKIIYIKIEIVNDKVFITSDYYENIYKIELPTQINKCGSLTLQKKEDSSSLVFKNNLEFKKISKKKGITDDCIKIYGNNFFKTNLLKFFLKMKNGFLLDIDYSYKSKNQYNLSIPHNSFQNSKIIIYYNFEKLNKEFYFKCYYSGNIIVKYINNKSGYLNDFFLIYGHNFSKKSIIYLLSDDKTCFVQNNFELISNNKIKIKFNLERYKYIKNFDNFFYNKKFYIYILNKNKISKINYFCYIKFNK